MMTTVVLFPSFLCMTEIGVYKQHGADFIPTNQNVATGNPLTPIVAIWVQL